MNKKDIKKNLLPYVFLLVFFIGCLVAFKMFNITDNPEDDFSPGFWFWEMIDNLGLIDQSNGKFSKSKVSKILYNFNNRLYDADGRGGNIFILYEYDIRKKEIWWQMCHYLDSYLNL